MYVPAFTGGEGSAMDPVQSPFRLHVDVDSATDEGAVASVKKSAIIAAHTKFVNDNS